MTEKEYWFWLCNIKGLWQGKIDKLFKWFGSPRQIYYADAQQFLNLEGISEGDVHNIQSSKKDMSVLKILDELQEKGIRFIHLGEKEYPSKLYNLVDKPYSLYVKGRFPEEKEKIIGIVGARACSTYGRNAAKSIAGYLGKNNIATVSGLARGIDSFAHKGSVEVGAPTFAVLGCGIYTCYPRENIELFEQIQHRGGIISEYPPNTPPLAWQFPHRNRLISGMSDGLVIVEAKEKSGSLITVTYALEQGKEILTVPGRLDDPLSKGCNRLIKNGAAIITEYSDILEELSIENIPKYENCENNNKALEKDLEVVYSCLSLFPKSIYTIIEETGLDIKNLMKHLIRLQLMDLVQEPVKNHYIRK